MMKNCCDYLRRTRSFMLSVPLLALVIVSVAQADHGLNKGSPAIKQAGSLAFGPDGILFVGDSLGAAVYAIDTGDRSTATERAEVNVEGINKKIAGMLGTNTNDTVINDMVVNPASGNIFLSVSRGKGPDASPAIFKADSKGQVSLLELDGVHFAKAELENAPQGKDRRGRDLRVSAITDLQYTDGKVIVAGLSNEEFASKLRVLEFPFSGADSSTSIEVFHGAHGRLETASPVRTFITYENTVLAAYTCTPLVTIPVDDLKGEKIMGKTVAELGNRNNPLDMIIYTKGEQDYLLLTNDRRGVMKMKLSKSELDSADSIKSRVQNEKAGLTYETLDQFENVSQLDKLSEEHAVMLVASSDDTVDLRTIALP